MELLVEIQVMAVEAMKNSMLMEQAAVIAVALERRKSVNVDTGKYDHSSTISVFFICLHLEQFSLVIKWKNSKKHSKMLIIQMYLHVNYLQSKLIYLKIEFRLVPSLFSSVHCFSFFVYRTIIRLKVWLSISLG